MSGDGKKKYDREYQQEKRDEKNEVGKLPPVLFPELRERALASLVVFLVELFEDLFPDPFGDVQLSSIGLEEQILAEGDGNLNKLEPRGYGKTTRSALGAIWACLRGSQDFVMVCCDSAEKSTDLLKIIHAALGENEKLLGCFPELYCFHKLDGNSHRCQYQTFKGESTKISIKGDTIYFPVLGKGLPSEGAMIVARPFSKARGKNVEGRRPTLVILDDVQSTEDAMSPTSVAKLVKFLTSDIAYLGTRKRPVAIINNATIIQKGDYPSRVSELPAFDTVRYKMVESMPTNKGLWSKYQDIRQSYASGDKADRKRARADALEFYVKNRDAMDEGAIVTWDHAYATKKSEISTIQAAMNFITDFGQESFDSECQNDPQEEAGPMDLLPVDEIMAKMNGVPANIVPLDCGTLVAFIDVHEEILDYEVWAFDERFGGSKVVGGTWPDQETNAFNHSKPPVPLSSLYIGLTDAARICEGLDDLWDHLLEGTWRREDDLELSITRCLVDANGVYSDDIKKACKRSKYRANLTPSYGMGITAKKIPISRLPNNKGRKDIGPEWAWKKSSAGEIRAAIFDANYWKTQFHKQLAMKPGEHGALFMHEADPESHRRSAEGYRAEKPTEVTANNRTVREWSLIPNRENHPFDCAVGCMVAASMEGVKTVGKPAKASKKLSLAELQRSRR